MSHEQWHSISHKSKQSSKNHQIKQERIKATLSLSRSLWSIHFSPPLATSYQKVPRKCIVLSRHSGLLFRWWWSPEHSKDEAFCRRGRSRGWSGRWSWWNWGCSWCRRGGSRVNNWHCRWPRTSWHSGKGISCSLASPFLHVILELLHCSLNLCHFDIQVIELLFHDSL